LFEQFEPDASLPDAAPALPPMRFPRLAKRGDCDYLVRQMTLSRPLARETPMAAPQIDIYTKFACPFCVRAKRLLSEKGAQFTEHDITMGGPKREEMLARAPNAMTVPQIFIGETHVGGSDDLAALERAGKLDALLAG
jgi:glutaredoxin 3